MILHEFGVLDRGWKKLAQMPTSQGQLGKYGK